MDEIEQKKYIGTVNAILKSVKRHAIDDLEEYSIAATSFDAHVTSQRCAIRIIAHRILKRERQLRIRTRTDA